MKCRPVRISSEGNILGEIAAERVVLDYPGLTARPEVCMSRTIDGDIWAAIGFNTGVRGAGGHAVCSSRKPEPQAVEALF